MTDETTTWAAQAIVAGGLYREEAQLRSYLTTVVFPTAWDAAEADGWTVDRDVEPAVAARFGAYSHDHGEGVDTYGTPCTDRCEIVGTDDVDAADVAYLRCEFPIVKAVDDADE